MIKSKLFYSTLDVHGTLVLLNKVSVQRNFDYDSVMSKCFSNFVAISFI